MKRLSLAAALALSVLAMLPVVSGQAPQQAPPSPPGAAPSIGGTAKTPGNIWLPAKKADTTSPALTPDEAMKTFSMPPGYHVQLVAAEPLIESPIIIDFDPDGRMWVLELQAFLPDTSGRDTQDPICSVAVLEDLNGDGTMDKRTVFADRLVLPRALKVLDRGVLIGEPPNLWLVKDTDGDLKADTKEAVYKNYGRFIGGVEHNANGLLWAMDNVLYTSEWNENLRLKDGRFDVAAVAQPRPVAGVAGRRRPHLSQRERRAAVRGLHAGALLPAKPERRAHPRPVRERDRPDGGRRLSRPPEPWRQSRLSRSVLPPDGSSIVIQGAGSPTVYRGDKYPADVRGSVFISDSPTNLVHRFNIVDDGSGRLRAKNVLRARRVPRVLGRAVPPGESLLGPRRNLVRGRHVPRRRPGWRNLVRLPARLHQEPRSRAASQARSHLARGVRIGTGDPGREAIAGVGVPRAAGRDAEPSERLVARYGAAAARRAW